MYYHITLYPDIYNHNITLVQYNTIQYNTIQGHLLEISSLNDTCFAVHCTTTFSCGNCVYYHYRCNIITFTSCISKTFSLHENL